LVKGGGKVGRRRGTVYLWSLPAVASCPGSTPTCRSVCYATTGRFLLPAVADRLEANLALSQTEWFAPLMIREVRRRRPPVVRIGGAGDFYSVAYIEAWQEVADATPATRYYFYSRSWAVPELRGPLEALGARRNVVAYWSLDKDSPPVGRVPPRTRLCFLMTDPEDRVPAGVSLVFRTRPLRREPLRRIGLATVCPGEARPDANVHCESCRLCFRPSPQGSKA
jgi:hypothetical protein